MQPPTSTPLEAVQGWLERGNLGDAFEELELIEPQLRGHPDVLELRCRIYAMADKWEYCRDIGNALARLTPERLSGWGNRVPMPFTSLDARRKPTTRSMPAYTGSGMSTRYGMTWPATRARWET